MANLDVKQEVEAQSFSWSGAGDETTGLFNMRPRLAIFVLSAGSAVFIVALLQVFGVIELPFI